MTAVTGEQTSLPVPPAPESGPCAWCSAPTSLKLTLAKARWGTAANGGRELRRPAQQVWVCGPCDLRLERSEGWDQ